MKCVTTVKFLKIEPMKLQFFGYFILFGNWVKAQMSQLTVTHFPFHVYLMWTLLT